MPNIETSLDAAQQAQRSGWNDFPLEIRQRVLADVLSQCTSAASQDSGKQQVFTLVIVSFAFTQELEYPLNTILQLKSQEVEEAETTQKDINETLYNVAQRFIHGLHALISSNYMDANDHRMHLRKCGAPGDCRTCEIIIELMAKDRRVDQARLHAKEGVKGLEKAIRLLEAMGEDREKAAKERATVPDEEGDGGGASTSNVK